MGDKNEGREEDVDGGGGEETHISQENPSRYFCLSLPLSSPRRDDDDDGEVHETWETTDKMSSGSSSKRQKCVGKKLWSDTPFVSFGYLLVVNGIECQRHPSLLRFALESYEDEMKMRSEECVMREMKRESNPIGDACL